MVSMIRRRNESRHEARRGVANLSRAKMADDNQRDIMQPLIKSPRMDTVSR